MPGYVTAFGYGGQDGDEQGQTIEPSRVRISAKRYSGVVSDGQERLIATARWETERNASVAAVAENLGPGLVFGMARNAEATSPDFLN